MNLKPPQIPLFKEGREMSDSPPQEKRNGDYTVEAGIHGTHYVLVVIKFLQ